MEYNASTRTSHGGGGSHIVWNPDGYSSLHITLIIIGSIIFFGSILMILYRMACGPTEPIFFGVSFRRTQKENNKKSIPLERE
jgi:hypothetical protein